MLYENPTVNLCQNFWITTKIEGNTNNIVKLAEILNCLRKDFITWGYSTKWTFYPEHCNCFPSISNTIWIKLQERKLFSIRGLAFWSTFCLSMEASKSKVRFTLQKKRLLRPTLQYSFCPATDSLSVSEKVPDLLISYWLDSMMYT